MKERDEKDREMEGKGKRESGEERKGEVGEDGKEVVKEKPK